MLHISLIAALWVIFVPQEPSLQLASEASIEDRSVRLKDELTTGSRMSESRFAYPGSSNRLSERFILEQLMPRSFPTTLEEEVGVSVQKTAFGQGSPFIRGFTAYHTVAMTDGIRLNNSVLRSGPNQYWATIDALALERIELIRGTSSVLYGSDAIGGVVEATFREREDYTEPFAAEGLIHLRYSSADQGLTSRLQVEGNAGEKFGFVLGLTRRTLDDLSGGRHQGTLPNSGYRDQHGDGKFTYKFGESSRLILAHQFSRNLGVPRTHRTIFAKSYRGTTIGNELRRDLDQDRDLTYARVILDDTRTLFDTARLTLSYQAQSEKRDRVRSDGRRDLQGFNVRTWGFDVEAQKDTDLGKWVYGADYYRDGLTSFRRDFGADGSLSGIAIQGPVADNATYDLVGAYVRNRIGVADDVELTPGIRVTYAAADADKVEDPTTGNVIGIDDSWTSVVGDLRLSWFPSEETHTYLSVAEGFRAPNLSDLTRLDTARSNEIETPNADLDPEKFVTFEVGTKIDREEETEGWSVEAAYFYTLIDDLIVTQPTGDVIDGDFEVTKRNASNGLVHGIELAGRYRFSESWTSFGNVVWSAGRVDGFPTSAPTSDSEPLSRRPPLKGHLGLRYQPTNSTYFVEGIMSVADEQDRLSARDKSDSQRIPVGGTPGYTIFTVRGGVQVHPRAWLSLAVENLTDRDYRIHGSGINEPGINFLAGLTVRL